MQRENVVIVDFGSQYSQLIARRVREIGVYCDLVQPEKALDEIEKNNPVGVILSGGPSSVYDDGAPTLDKKIFQKGIPVLGICYGFQLMTHLLGGKVEKGGVGEYGVRLLKTSGGVIFDGTPATWNALMSHSDLLTALPGGFKALASTQTCPFAAAADESKGFYGVQFHPEVVHSEYGGDVLKNFLFKVCKAEGKWNISDFALSTVDSLKKKIGDKKVLCALSGGVDSAVAAALVHKACPGLVCIFVDHGLLRKGEADEVVRVFRDEQKMNLIKVDASQRFMEKLKGVSDPEQKRKIIGSEFIRVFEEEGKKIGKVDYLVQGTIYPDVIESGKGKGSGAVIKSHHNVGGLPSVIEFKEIVEPLRDLFKDEVRRCGTALGLPKSIVMRQPFPGPGLAIRIIGEITEEKLVTLRDADYIFREEIAEAGLDSVIWQYFAVLTGNRTVGVMGDYRTYDYTLALRAVTSVDGMTAEWAEIPYSVLKKVSSRIVNEVKSINRVVYDVTSKPPATIEWE